MIVVVILGVTLLGIAVILFFRSRWRSKGFQRLYEAERELRASERRFKTAFDKAPVGISLTLPDGRVGSVNATLTGEANRIHGRQALPAEGRLGHLDDSRRDAAPRRPGPPYRVRGHALRYLGAQDCRGGAEGR